MRAKTYLRFALSCAFSTGMGLFRMSLSMRLRKNRKKSKFPIDKGKRICYNTQCRRERRRADLPNARKHSSAGRASALQAEGHRFEPYCFHSFPRGIHGPVVQLVRTLACHARGLGFEPPSGRHFASVAQSVEQETENLRVVGSIPTGSTIPRI